MGGERGQSQLSKAGESYCVLGVVVVRRGRLPPSGKLDELIFNWQGETLVSKKEN